VYPSTLTDRLLAAFLTSLKQRGGRVIVWLAVIVGLPVHAAQSITPLLSEPAGIYQEAARALQRELTLQGARGASVGSMSMSDQTWRALRTH